MKSLGRWLKAHGYVTMVVHEDMVPAVGAQVLEHHDKNKALLRNRKATLEQVIAERLAAMGEEPSPETLLAWREGRLSASEREQLLERAAADPALARELLDTKAGQS